MAAALVMVLAWQNRGLREQVRWLAERTRQPYLGMYVPSIAVRTLDNAQATLGSPTAEYQVLYFFTHTCPYCQASAGTIRQTAQMIETDFRGRAQMLGVCHCSEDEARTYAAQYGLKFPIATVRDHRTLMLFRARDVPLVLAIGRDGRVHHARLGTFNTKEQVQDLLAVLRRTDTSAAAAIAEE